MGDKYYEAAEASKQKHIRLGQERYDEITYREEYIDLRGGKDELNQRLYDYLKRIENKYVNASDAIECGFRNLGYDVSQVNATEYDPNINYELVAYVASYAADDLRECERDFGNSEGARELYKISDDLYNILVED